MRLALPSRVWRRAIYPPSCSLQSVQPVRSFASRRSAAIPSTADQDKDWQAARLWSTKLNPQTIPRSICEIAFSRSSGPGGQNVNKLALPAHQQVPS